MGEPWRATGQRPCREPRLDAYRCAAAWVHLAMRQGGCGCGGALADQQKNKVLKTLLVATKTFIMSRKHQAGSKQSSGWKC